MEFHSIVSTLKDLMAEDDSPTVARRRVRIALREAREAAGFAQSEVAEEMEWSLSKVIRIENGDASIAPNDLRPLLAYLNVKDRAQVATLIESAKIARTRQRQAWYQTPEYRQSLTDPLHKLIEYEAEAASIQFSVFHILGSLQIMEHPSVLIDMWSEDLEQSGYRLQARKLRRDAALGRVGLSRMTALFDESAFRTRVAGTAVPRAQLQELIRMSEIAMRAVRMVPFSTPVAMSYNARFDNLFLADDGDLSCAVMYRETGTTDEILEDAAVEDGRCAASPHRTPQALDSTAIKSSGTQPAMKMTQSPLLRAVFASWCDQKSLYRPIQRILFHQTSKLTRKVRVNSRGDPVDRRTNLRSIFPRDSSRLRGPPIEAVRRT
ncbi:transcriptional regulator with XRE-family HTH domain [Actinoplanes tereljensis]|uniref:HTH cro/C1-type domain-containing protein n=1 Tax=Paractinoplanes tereljensis TaxID=571912 RepID=A0A919NQ52_9ACTN|nr:Scr1 family TA system antitoxin-like transcriptional regulator [Actinoplanes tereljensis]GIF22628.1 hypothetical protein Ate02nite_53580 [Actinoplanes tereljensis]